MTEPYRTFDPSSGTEKETYFQLTSIVVPRPIAWISTVAADGAFNLAPFSFTTFLSGRPPILGFVALGEKDSLRNARETGDFVYNIGNRELLERLLQTSAELHREESEFEWTGLTPIPSEAVKSPRVAEAPISMECTLLDVIRFGEGHLVAGEVVRIHVAERLFTGDRIDPEKLQPVSRLSGKDHAALGEIIKLTRPSRQDLIDLGMQPNGGRGLEF